MSYTNLLYHIVYGTKDRFPLITKELRPRLHEYLGGLINGLHGTPLEINGTADHVHVLARIKPVISISEFPEQIQIEFVGLGQATRPRKIQMAGQVRCIHRESITGRPGATLHPQSGGPSCEDFVRGGIQSTTKSHGIEFEENISGSEQRSGD